MIKISKKNKVLINNLFSQELGFTRVAIDRNSHMDRGEVKMWCNVIKSGFLELDYNFLLSGSCKAICTSLLLSYEHVIEAFLKVEVLIFKEINE